MSVKITWLGHACFKIEQDSFSIIIDPYNPDMQSMPKPPFLGTQPRANIVLCSHSHGDHGFKQAVEIIPLSGETKSTITKINSFHDAEGGQKRGENTIHVVEVGGFRLAHMGDLGHLPDDAQYAAMGRIDVAMVPVGGHFTIGPNDAKIIKDRLNPAVFIPMHYKGEDFGNDVLAPLSDFLPLVDDAVLYNSAVITVDGQTKTQTAVLAYSPEE